MATVCPHRAYGVSYAREIAVETVAGVRHDQLNRWEFGDSTIVESDVTYTRKDSTAVTVPVVTIYRSSSGAIADYRVFIDLAPLFA